MNAELVKEIARKEGVLIEDNKILICVGTPFMVFKKEIFYEKGVSCMKIEKVLKSIFLLCFFVLSTSLVFANENDIPSFKRDSFEINNNSKEKFTTVYLSKDKELVPCWDEARGVKIMCNPNWQIFENDDTIIYVISKNPDASLIINKRPTDIKFIGQLNREYISASGQYQDDFKTDYAKLAKRNAIVVKGFYKPNPKVKLLDYYLLYNSNLYSFLFSVNPKEDWENYRLLIKHIIENLEFTGRLVDNRNFSEVSKEAF